MRSAARACGWQPCFGAIVLLFVHAEALLSPSLAEGDYLAMANFGGATSVALWLARDSRLMCTQFRTSDSIKNVCQNPKYF